jgi:hypothetical protein
LAVVTAWKWIWEETKIVRIRIPPSPEQITVDEKQKQNVEYFNYFCSMKTNDATFARGIKSRIDIAKAASNTNILLNSK